MHKLLLIFKVSILGLIFMGPISFTFAEDDADTQKIREQMQNMQQQTQALMKQLKSFEGKKFDPSKLPGGAKKGMTPNFNMTPEQLDQVAFMVQKQYQHKDVPEIVIEIKGRITNGHAKMITEKFPKTLIFAAYFLKDNKALRSLLRVYENKKKLKTMGLVLLSTILVSWLLGKVLIREGQALGRRLMMRLVKVGMIAFIRLGVVLYFLGPELKPTIQIATKVFF